MGAGGLTSDEAKLILVNDSASLAKIAHQLQEEAESARPSPAHPIALAQVLWSPLTGYTRIVQRAGR
jgi:hypothetical protein